MRWRWGETEPFVLAFVAGAAPVFADALATHTRKTRARARFALSPVHAVLEMPSVREGKIFVFVRLLSLAFFFL
jgi:hypothetical protein